MAYTRVYAPLEPARAEVDALVGDTLLEFGAPWCGHCIAAQPLWKPRWPDVPACAI